MQSSHDDGSKPSSDDGKKIDEYLRQESKCKDQEKEDNVNSTNNVNAVSTNGVNIVGENISNELPFDPNMPDLEDISTFNFSNDHEDDDAMADMSNLDTTIQSSHDDGSKPSSDDGKKIDEYLRQESKCKDQEKEDNVNSTNNVNAASTNGVNIVGENISNELPFDQNMPDLEDISTFNFSNDHEDDDAMADMSNLDTTIQVSPTLTIRIYKDHPFNQVIGDLHLATQTRQMFTEVKNASTPMETQKPLLKDEDGKEVDVHMYRLMIGLLMYLTSSRPDIMFALIRPGMAYYCQLKVNATSTMTSAIICLATNQKFNFSKLIFDTMIGNLDNVWKISNVSKISEGATTASSLEVDQDNGGGPRCQDSIGDTFAQTRSKRVSKLSNNSLLARGRKIHDIDDDEDITLVNDQNDAKMFDADKDLHGEEVLVTKQDEVQKVIEEIVEDINTIKLIVDVAQVSAAGEVNIASIATTISAAATTTTKVDEVTLAQALVELKHTKPKAKWIILQEQSESTTTTKTISSKSHDKGKAKMIEKHVKPKKKDQIKLDEEAAKIDVDHQLAERLQVEEQQELNDEETATLIMQLLEKRRKFFAPKRAEEKRNKPPTQAQQRKIMCTYLKNVEGKKLTDLKNKSFNSIQKMFDRGFKMVNTFVDFITELVEGSSKRAGEELKQESAKKQKVDDEKK
nr:ribonuclease H-like domain, reverse transcriptase, RNA-dependent DNA polymerase [Tanacetum cinerariifolium]